MFFFPLTVSKGKFSASQSSRSVLSRPFFSLLIRIDWLIRCMALGYRELIGSIGPEHLYRFDVRRFYTLFLRRRSKYMARILTIDVSISSFVSYDSHIEGS